jgi:hypothetical protein
MARKKKSSLEEKVEKVALAKESEKAPLKSKVKKTRKRRKSYSMDLRIHSPSSLGYLGINGIDTAPALVRLAKVKGLDVIAVTDFYSGDYIDRISEAAEESPVTVLPGVVIRAALPVCNDIVLMVIFPEHFRTADVDRVLQALKVPDSAKGNSDFIVPLPFDEVLSVLDSFEGITVPSRMDKTPYRREALAELVEDYGFRAFDLAYFPESKNIFKANWPKIEFELLSFSNANALAQVGSRISKVKMGAPGFAGLQTLVERQQL